MVSFGFLVSLELDSPSTCLEQATMVEEAGFDRVWPVDHFHPWFDHFEDGREANGGNCWSWMPAALERTAEVEIGPGVTGIIHRHHPALVAQRLATMQDLYPGRVFLGLGSGEAINELPLGYPWPDYPERARRTAEAIRIIRRLYEEDHIDFDGHFWTLENAHLYTRPGDIPPIYVAASGSTSARMAGDLGDGLLSPSTDPGRTNEELFPALERGVEKSDHNRSVDDIEKIILLHCSYAETESAALQACKPWRAMLLPEMRAFGDPRYLQAHGEEVDVERLRERILPITDPQQLVELVGRSVDVGFDHVLFQSSSPDQERFVDIVRDEVMPAFA